MENRLGPLSYNSAFEMLRAQGYAPVPGSSRFENAEGQTGRITEVPGRGDVWYVETEGNDADLARVGQPCPECGTAMIDYGAHGTTCPRCAETEERVLTGEFEANASAGRFADGFAEGQRDRAAGHTRQLCTTGTGERPPVVKRQGRDYYHGYKAAAEGATSEPTAYLGYRAKHRGTSGMRQPEMSANARGADDGAANVRRWMSAHVAEYVDPLTGEVNSTKLAEEAAHDAGVSEWLDDHTHPIWDWALDAAARHERSTGMHRANARGGKPFFGAQDTWSYGIKIDGIENDFPTKPLGRQEEWPHVQWFMQSAKSDWISAKHASSGTAALKRWVKAVKPDQFYAKWNEGDDSFQVWYTGGEFAANARGLYHETSASEDDYAIHPHHHGGFAVDRIGRGGTHTTIGPTTGYPTITDAIRAIEADAYVHDVGTCVVFLQGADDLHQIGNLSAHGTGKPRFEAGGGFAPGAASYAEAEKIASMQPNMHLALDGNFSFGIGEGEMKKNGLNAAAIKEALAYVHYWEARERGAERKGRAEAAEEAIRSCGAGSRHGLTPEETDVLLNAIHVSRAELTDLVRSRRLRGHSPNESAGATCDRCGKPLNPAARMLGPICGECVRKAHQEATGGHKRNASGYTDCACRDCFEIAITSDGPALCGDCEAAGCDVEGEGECQRDDAYEENPRKNVTAVIDAFRDGRAKREATCHTDGDVVWSYGLPIAARIHGEVVVLDPTESPSRTTTSQIRAVLAELPNAQTVLSVKTVVGYGEIAAHAEPMRENGRGSHESKIIGETTSGKSVMEPDSGPYQQRFRLPKWNIEPTVLMMHGKPPAHVLNQLFPGWTKEDHAEAAEIMATARDEANREWNKLVQQAVKKHGDGNGHLISGVYREHFSDTTKDVLRYLAHFAGAASNASYMHYVSTGKRTPYHQTGLHSSRAED